MHRYTHKHVGMRARTILVAAVCLLSALVVPVTSVSAETLSEKISNLQTQIDAAQSQADKYRAEADTLQNALNIITAEKQAIQAQVDFSQAKLDQLTVQIEENRKKLEKQQSVLGATVAELSVESDSSPIELLAGSGSIGDFIDRQEYRDSVQDQLNDAMREVRRIKADLDRQRKEVEGLLAQQRVQRDQLAAKEAEQARLVEATRSQESVYQAQVGDLKKQQAAAQAALAASMSSRSYATAPAGYVTAGAVVGAVGSTGMSTGPHLHLEVRTASGAIVNPAPYITTQPVSMPPGYVSQSFGNIDPMYARGYHPGTDYAAITGTPIFAIADGMMYRGCSQQLLGTWAYGYVAIIEHGNGTRSIYAHMSGGPGC